jgi:hypothetical protein
MKLCSCTTKKGHPCTLKASFGPLCRVHVRQLSTAGTGWRWRKIVRNHMSDIDPTELVIAVDEYRDEMGPMHPRPYSAGAYDSIVIRSLKVSPDQELSTDQIHEIICKVADREFSTHQIGRILGQMAGRGSLVRTKKVVEGRKISLWRLVVNV